MDLHFTQHIFQIFKGKWDISRTLLTAGETQLIAAQAEFNEIDANNLYYREAGIVKIHSSEQKFYRDYLYNFLSETNAIKVYFIADQKRGAYFHTLQLHSHSEAVTTCKAEHVCLNDRYEICYTFFKHTNNKFEIAYEVTGPRKKYKLINYFSRRDTNE